MRNSRHVATVATLVLLALALGAFAGSRWWGSTTSTSSAVVRFGIPLAANLTPTGVVITPGGDTVVIEADRLYLRGLGDLDAHAIPGTEGARNLFLSTDGRWAGFYAGGKIKKVSLAGGDPLTIADADIDTPGAAWGPGNTVLFSGAWSGGLFSVSADGGGKPVALTTVDTTSGELGHWWPQMLPDGKTILFTVWMAAAGINDSQIAAVDTATGRHRILMPGAFARYLASGHLLYFHAGAYHVVPFDLAGLRPTGDARKVLPDALPHDPNGTRHKPIAVSETGVVAYIRGRVVPDRQFSRASMSGTMESINLPPRPFASASLGPDGRRLAASRVEAGTHTLWLYDLSRQTEEKLDLPGSNSGPHWSPTGAFFTFTSMRAGHFDVSVYRVDEGRAVSVITEPLDQTPDGVTPDGKHVVFHDYQKDGTSAIAEVDLENPNRRRRLADGAGSIYVCEVSPDGRWMALQLTGSGRPEIVVQPYEAKGPIVRVSTRGGDSPVWSTTAPKLFYRRGDELVAVTYAVSEGRFAVVREDTLFRLPGFSLIDLAPDGRFLVSTATTDDKRDVRVVVNWFSELKAPSTSR